jgi:hypothetical protein
MIERDPQTGVTARTRWIFFVKSEGDFTSEMGWGQFSIFGAIEEKIGHGFSRINTDEAMAEERGVDAPDDGGFDLRGSGWRESGRVGRRNIHRGRTGNAESAVLGTQYSVLSTQYSVLSTQYSVLSTQLEEDS